MESFRILRQLTTLADVGSFRSAAVKLGITHSALSQAVKRLEENYGISIFARRGGQVVPTAYGQILVDTARESLRRFEDAEREISLMQSLESGRLIIGCDHNCSESVVAAALSRLIEEYPKLRFNLLVRDWHEMQDDLHRRKIDLYVGLAPDNRSPGIIYEPLWMPPPVLVCKHDHPLTQKADRHFLDVLDYPIVGSETPDWLIGIVSDAFPEAFPTVATVRDRFLVTQDSGVLPFVISHSKALGVVPPRVVWMEMKAGLVTILHMPDHPYCKNVPGVMACLENRVLPPAAEAFRAEIRRELAEFNPPS